MGVSRAAIGLWYFCMPDGQMFVHSGCYHVSRRAASAHARKVAVGPFMRVQVSG